MRARARSADDVIESGEIVERRSLVIRSQPVPVVEWNDAPTEITATPLQVRRPPPAVRLAALAGAIVFGIAGIVFALRARPDSSNVQALEARADMLATTIDGDARAAMVRAEAIASNPVLRAGVETDAATLLDMAHDSDVVFPIKGAEVVEVFQVKDGARASMLRLPKGAAALQPPAVGKTKLVAGEGELLVIADAQVANRSNGKASLGEVALAVPIDLNAVRKRVAPSVTGATLVGLGAPVTLVPSTNGGAGTHVKLPIDTEGKAPLTLDATVAVATPPASAANGSSSKLKAVRYAFFGLAGLLLLVFLGTSARRSS